MPAASQTVRGQILAPIRSPYALLIRPAVALKQFFQLLHRLVVSTLWSELIQGEVVDQAATIVVALIFCLLSLLAYQGRAISGFGFGFFCLLWVLDCQIARQQFRSQRSIFTTLEVRGDWVVWQQVDGATESEAAHLKFQLSEVAQISLIRTQVRGGAFQEVLGAVWQVYLTQCDRSELLLHEALDPGSAFAKATEASRCLAVPIIVIGSEGAKSQGAKSQGAKSQGASRYAAQSLDLSGLVDRTKTCSTIGCRKSAQRWHIFCEWRFSSTWQWLGESLSRFGFLLFAVIVANLMILVGGLMHQAAIGTVEPISITALISALMLRWQLWMPLAVAGGIMLIKGAQLSREEHFYITADSLTFCLGSQKIAQLPTSSITDLLFLNQPFPALLILGEQSIEIRELQHEAEFRAMLLHLQAAIDYFNFTKP